MKSIHASILNSFRYRLLILFAGLSFLLLLCSTFFIEKIASDQMSKERGLNLLITAKSISNRLANSLTEREREIILLSQSPFIAESDFNNPRIQQQLDQVQESYKYYAWLGIANPTGNVVVAADDLLKGVNVKDRAWFKGGLVHPYLGDVHEAVLLAKKVKALNPNEPLRFIDFAAPIYDPKTQRIKGVLAAHADWSWASHVLETSLTENAEKRDVQVFITNKNGEILYPYRSIGIVHPPKYNAQQTSYFLDDWGTDQNYFTVNFPVVSATTTDMGWHVVIRQPVSVALSKVHALQRQILFLGGLFTLLVLYVAYRIAGRFSTPIESLAHSARSVEKGDENINFYSKTNIWEIKTLSQSLQGMTDTLLAQKNELKTANENLEAKVEQRTKELSNANIELKKLARHDALTNLYNRRAFNEHLDNIFRQFKRDIDCSYHIFMLDIDYFKKVNDRYGHDVGDFVLKSVAKILTTSVRKTDFIARLGGEEFVIILPKTEPILVKKIAEKIRNTIEATQILEQQGITISIGISKVDEHDTSMHEVMIRADKGLYVAKEQGRNQVVIDY